MMKILLATDGSSCAQAAIDFLLKFPFPKESEVTLLTVVEKDVYTSKKKTELSDEQLDLLQQTKQMLHDEAEAVLASGAARLKTSGWTGSTLIRRGHAAREIVRAAKQLAVDLVIVGSHGLTGIKRFLLGSVSDQVLAYAPCSVLIVKSSESDTATESTAESGQADTAEPIRILIAYDDSAPARRAVDFCASLALVEGTEVNAITVLPLVTLYRQDIKQRLSWVWKEKKKIAENALERVRHEIEWNTPHVSIALRESSDVSHEILDIAENKNSDLIILGHKGKGAIEKFLLGSVTKRIAHHAKCSVLAVRNCKI